MAAHRTIPIKVSWVERAKQVNEFHVSQLKDDPSWRIQDTADQLNRSLGSVSQDLLIASWLKTHPNQISKCRRLRDALDFIRKKKYELKVS